ncbi:Glycerophosphodiester phosphodiesterase domain-containing protein 4 [Myotis davidii]|uniref:Glycerophosphodiester phosphodiesterase domain-containing protein 4 n=1 Tax=Myotis davidii TaxID=225400 RepID=L5LVU0_MYODS|nr:Glycerophosphodiester phosphodiesterase domain-containing protein 4 [Myotis davidii]
MEEEKKQETRRLKRCSSCIEDNCNHECYVTYITGLYSCQWEGKLEKQSGRRFCCCSLVEQLFYPFLILGFLLIREGYEPYLFWCHKLAPENTMMSFEKAVENDAFGLETDVFLSIDEVPFLMHDHNLRRTTNIREVKPNESYTATSFFYWKFLSTLNAGEWFVDSWVYWLPGFDRDYVRWKAPNFQHVGRLDPVAELKKENISIINVDYKRLFHNGLSDYKAANFIINLYIVNEPWVFSLAWCSKINSVTTDDIVLLRQITYPDYSMTPKSYVLLWVLLDCISAVFIFTIFYFHW